MSVDADDKRETYCRKLGHAVPFKYCRGTTGDLPCRLLPDCWYTQFDVAVWLAEHYAPEQITKILAPPPPKIASIVDLIEKARHPSP